MHHHRYDTCGEISAVYDQRLYKRSREIPEGGREDGSLEACWKQLGGRRCHINIYVNLLFFKTNVGTRAAIVTSGGMRSGLTSLRPHHHHHDTFGVYAPTVRTGCYRASLYQSRAEPFVSDTAPHVIAQLRTAARLKRARCFLFFCFCFFKYSLSG